MDFCNSKQSWTNLLAVASAQPIEEARQTYQYLINEYPTCAMFWHRYIDAEIQARAYSRVEALFNECLMDVPKLELWTLYLSYLQETKSNLRNYQQILLSAFELSLSKVGYDFCSKPLWVDYITLLDRMVRADLVDVATLRSLYVRAIGTPMQGLEGVHEDWCAFERLHGGPAPGPLDIYLLGACKDLETVFMCLDRSSPCKLGLSEATNPMSKNVVFEDQRQWVLWQRYIEWEQGCLFPDETRFRRVCFAFEQCILSQPHRSNAWLGYLHFLLSARRLPNAQVVFERALAKYMKHNELLGLYYADYMQLLGNACNAETCYVGLINDRISRKQDPTLAVIGLMSLKRRESREIFLRYLKVCSHRLFISHALAEYCLGGGRRSSVKILELGMERFGHLPQYACAYLDLMGSHDSDYNNTRVLFERVLEQIGETERLSYAWGCVYQRFMAFEDRLCNANGSMSIHQRRVKALSAVHNFPLDRYSVALLNDRYSTLGLMPLEGQDRIVYGVDDIAMLHGGGKRISQLASADARYVLPEPCTALMLPYNPCMNAPTGFHLLPGGMYPEPAACYDLLRQLPPPSCFQGPFVMIDRLIDIMGRSSEEVEPSATAPVLLTSTGSGGEGSGLLRRATEFDVTKQSNLYRRRMQRLNDRRRRKHAVRHCNETLHCPVPVKE